MGEPTRVSHPVYSLLPTEVEGFASPGRAGPGPALVLEPLRRRSLAPAGPGPLGAHPEPVGGPPDRLAGQAAARLAEPGFREKVEPCVQARRKAAEAPAWFQQTYPQIAADLRGLFQHGIHAERGAADLFGRPGQRGRRPAQGGQRPGRAGGRRRPALPAGLFPPGDRQRRAPAGPLPLQRPGPAADHAPAPAQTASGSASKCACRATPSGCGPGRSRSAV